MPLGSDKDQTAYPFGARSAVNAGTYGANDVPVIHPRAWIKLRL